MCVCTGTNTSISFIQTYRRHLLCKIVYTTLECTNNDLAHALIVS